MTPKEEYELAIQLVEQAKAELDAARAEVAEVAGESRPTPLAKVRGRRRGVERPVHRTGLPTGCYGTGERFTGIEKVRVDIHRS